jgi:hypothetical protein
MVSKAEALELQDTLVGLSDLPDEYAELLKRFSTLHHEPQTNLDNLGFQKREKRICF